MRMIKKRSEIILFCLVALLLSAGIPAAKEKPVNWKKVKVLVYTKNGKGYVHDNIPFAVKCIQKLSQQYGFAVDVADTGLVFTENNLKQYTFLLFPSTNNDVFENEAQRIAFRRYIQAGGGFVGLHSVTGTERNWKWFKKMVGGTFTWHARNQLYQVKVIDPSHPAVRGLPLIWEHKDECYFAKELNPGVKVLMAHDINSLNVEDSARIRQYSAPFADLYPASWYNQFDGGNVWITALGHDKENYEEPVYIRHIFQGMEFVAGLSKKLDYTKAYAKERDDVVVYR